MNFNQNHNNNGSNHKKHMWLMMLGCAIPLLLLLALPALKNTNAGSIGILTGAAFLLCPLMHLLMLPMMFGWGKRDKESNQAQYQPVPIEADNNISKQ